MSAIGSHTIRLRRSTGSLKTITQAAPVSDHGPLRVISDTRALSRPSSRCGARQFHAGFLRLEILKPQIVLIGGDGGGDDPVCTENLNPDVMVMKSAKDRV